MAPWQRYRTQWTSVRIISPKMAAIAVHRKAILDFGLQYLIKNGRRNHVGHGAL